MALSRDEHLKGPEQIMRGNDKEWQSGQSFTPEKYSNDWQIVRCMVSMLHAQLGGSTLVRCSRREWVNHRLDGNIYFLLSV